MELLVGEDKQRHERENWVRSASDPHGRARWKVTATDVW